MNDIQSLRERAKELRCLYAIDSIIADRAQSPASVFVRVLDEVPGGWQCSRGTGARIEYLGRNYSGRGFDADAELFSEAITVWGAHVGRVWVSVTPGASEGSTPAQLPEEAELLRRIARRLGEFLEWKHSELLGEQTSGAARHWAWRQRFAEALADSIDTERFGVSRVYLGGSTARGDAGSASDIDLYIQCHGSPAQRRDLSLWLEGWSLCLGEVVLQQTGQDFPGGILNIQWLPAEPCARQSTELQELALPAARAGHHA